MTSTSRNSSRKTLMWIALLVALAALSYLAMRRGMGKAMQMKAEATATASLAQLKPGNEAKVVLEVTAVAPPSRIEGNVLAEQSETVYRRTGNTMKIAFDTATPVLMGKASDVHEGAVVHITATMGKDQVLHAGQIVVLTGYVTVK